MKKYARETPWITTGQDLLNPEFATVMHTLSAIGAETTPLPQAGPNSWDEITPDDYGKEYDYIIERHGNRTVIDPVSKAAVQWCYRFLPEDAPRWGAGFVLDTARVSPILDRMACAELVSDEEYTFNMNAEERDRRAWE